MPWYAGLQMCPYPPDIIPVDHAVAILRGIEGSAEEDVPVVRGGGVRLVVARPDDAQGEKEVGLPCAVGSALR